MFVPVAPLLDAYDKLIQNDIESSHFVKLPENYDSFEYDDGPESVFDVSYDY